MSGHKTPDFVFGPLGYRGDAVDDLAGYSGAVAAGH
jgi:hypothetical protein